MPEQKKWKEFETLVAQVQRTLAPQAKVTQNERIRGQRSKTFREIDIVVRQTIGQFNIFIAIDCKDYRTPVDVKDIEQFIGLVEDVGANKGAIVSAMGFTETAKTRAKDAGIDVYRLIDAEKHNWQTYVTIPVLCDFRKLKNFKLKFEWFTNFPMKWKDEAEIILRDRLGKPIGTSRQLLGKKWNDGLLPIEPGIHMNIHVVDVQQFIESGGALFQVDVMADILVEKNLYFGQLPLTNIRGFEDQVTRELFTKGFTTDWLDPVEVEKNWQKVKSEENLAIRPLFTLTEYDSYLLLN